MANKVTNEGFLMLKTSFNHKYPDRRRPLWALAHTQNEERVPTKMAVKLASF